VGAEKVCMPPHFTTSRARIESERLGETFGRRARTTGITMEAPTRAVSAAPARDVGGIAIDWLFESPTVRLTRWACLARDRGVTAEKQQFWHVVGFPHGGSYVLQSEGDAALIDLNSIAFFNPLGVYRTSHPNGCGDHGAGIVVRPDVIADALSEWGGEGNPAEARFPFLRAPSSPRAFWIQHLVLSRLAAPSSVDPLEVEESALALVAESISAGIQLSRNKLTARPGTARRRRESVDAARGYLAVRFRTPVKLSEVAEAAGVSPFHACRMFKLETGVSITRFLHRLRVRAALAELPGCRGDITRLALDLGYSSHSHFTFAFRREFGVPPSAAWDRAWPLPAASLGN
jgi:AraC-like DNA-binding protein